MPARIQRKLREQINKMVDKKDGENNQRKYFYLLYSEARRLFYKGSLLLLLLLSMYLIYANTTEYSHTIGLNNLISTKNNQQQRIARYLNDIKNQENRNYGINTFTSSNMISFIENLQLNQVEKLDEEMMSNINNYMRVIEETILYVQNMNTPKSLQTYHETLLKKYELIHELLLRTTQILEMKNKQNSQKSIFEISLLLKKLDLLENRKKNELIEVFEATGMDYQVQAEGDITYWWVE